MRQTKCLFDEKMAPEGMVSVSQLQTFLSCKKKWEYNYIDNLKPRVERSYLTIGKLCHKGMQVAMQELWEVQRRKKRGVDWFNDVLNRGIQAMYDEWDYYMEMTDFLDEELTEINQTVVDAESVFRQAFEEFEPWKYEVVTLCDKGKPIPALELHFKVPCRPTKGLHGYIDAVLKDRETGFTWCVDYKFRKSLSPDEDEAYNIQNCVYAYACKKMGINITGTMTWQHLNAPAANPKINKDGSVSKAKIKTTLKHYTEFCLDHGIKLSDSMLLEMKDKLKDIEWYRSTLEYRNDETILKIWKECVVPVAKQVKRAHNKTADNFRSLYPWNCKMCQYQSICQAELRNYDVNAIVEREYIKRDVSNR